MLMNYDGELCKPGDLFLIPPDFRVDNLDQRVPLLLSPSTRKHYLSDVYGEACETAILGLGVRKLTLKDFVRDLSTICEHEPIFFRSQPQEWHNALAWRLTPALKSYDKDGSQRNQVRRLAIVPLSDNQWCSANESGLFLPGSGQYSSNVEGLGVKLVHAEAAMDRARASLFEYLDIKVVNDLEICNLIAKLHRRERSAMLSLKVSELVSQILFLFRVGWRNDNHQEFWFASEAGIVHPGSSLYLRSSQTFSASQYSSELLGHLTFVHPDYFSGKFLDGNAEIFNLWLQNTMHVNLYIRIFQLCRSLLKAEEALNLSSEFGALVSHAEYPSWLLMLKNNWQHYVHVLDTQLFLARPTISASATPLDALRDRHRTLLEQMGDISVICKDGTWAPLKRTHLPLPMLNEHVISGVSLIDVPLPEDPLWRKLKCIGLGIEPDLMFFMRCLERLSEDSRNGQSSPDASTRVTTYLEQIQARHAEDAEMVKLWFREKCLIRVNPSRSGTGMRWVNSSLCLWEGSKCFRHQPVLKETYPGCETLFRKVLAIDNASSSHLAVEARFLDVGDDLEHIHDLLTEIQKRLEKFEPEDACLFQALLEVPMFPIFGLGPRSNAPSKYDDLMAANSRTSWFIADQQELHQSFLGKIPLLALQFDQISLLKNLFHKFGIDVLRLSRCVQGKPGKGSRAQYDFHLAQDFRSRVPFFLRYVWPVALATNCRVYK